MKEQYQKPQNSQTNKVIYELCIIRYTFPLWKKKRRRRVRKPPLPILQMGNGVRFSAAQEPSYLAFSNETIAAPQTFRPLLIKRISNDIVSIEPSNPTERLDYRRLKFTYTNSLV